MFAFKPPREEAKLKAYKTAADLRRKMGVRANTEGERKTDAALKAIDEALALRRDSND